MVREKPQDWFRPHVLRTADGSAPLQSCMRSQDPIRENRRSAGRSGQADETCARLPLPASARQQTQEGRSKLATFSSSHIDLGLPVWPRLPPATSRQSSPCASRLLRQSKAAECAIRKASELKRLEPKSHQPGVFSWRGPAAAQTGWRHSAGRARHSR